MAIERLAAGDPDTQSVDVVVENIGRLRGLFPEAFTEGKVDFDVLRQLLGDAVEDGDERYGLNWRGKRAARRLALTPSTGALRPAPEESVDWDTTQNLMIEGDNLEVLKLLQKSYAGKVKLIYIDPPYNTGKDFVYPDDFQDGIRNYLEITGQVGEGGRVSSNTETSGRFHTDWLNMMYSRLLLARGLLRYDGFIVVSIDDGELQNLLALLDDIFGDENCIATLVFDRNRKNDAKYFSVGHEYMVVYARDKATLDDLGLRLRAPKEGVEEVREEFERLRREFNDDWDRVAAGLREFYATFEEDDPRTPLARFTRVDERGPYRSDGNPSWPGGGGPRYEVVHPVTGKPCKVPSRGWVWPTQERMQQQIDAGNIIFGPDETTIPSVRMNLFERAEQVMRSVNFSYAQKAAQDLQRLFDGKKVFDNPKNYIDLQRLIEYLTEPRDLTLDFFAGSGSTGHGVWAANCSSEHQRHFVLVQLPEPVVGDSETDRNLRAMGCHTLADLCRERLRRAAAKIRKDHPDYDGDLGFRVFKLDSSNIREWDPQPEDLDTALELSVENLKADRTEQDILYELLLKRGIELTVPIETQEISGKAVHSIGAGTLFACLAERIERADAEPLALGIAEWRDALNSAGDVRVVFRDSGFVDDVAKTNLAEILKQHGLADVKSI